MRPFSRTTAASPPHSWRWRAPRATVCGWIGLVPPARHGARALRGRGRRLPRDRRRRRGAADGATARPVGYSQLAPAGTHPWCTPCSSYAALTGSGRHRDVAEGALLVTRRIADSSPRFAGWGLAAAQTALDGPVEVAVVGPAGAERDRPRTDGAPARTPRVGGRGRRAGHQHDPADGRPRPRRRPTRGVRLPPPGLPAPGHLGRGAGGAAAALWG